MLVRSRTRPTPRARRGMTIVEVALMLGIFLLFMFGVFEYCRYLLVLQVATNAARDGARYAAVNVDKPSNFDTTAYSFSYTNATGGTTTKSYQSIQSYTTGKMAGLDKMITGYTVSVFACNTSYLYSNDTSNTVQVAPKSGATWNQAAFTERIAVTITGTYQPILPNFLFMNSSINVNVVGLAGSEG